MTPRMFAAAMRRKHDELAAEYRADNIRAGTIAAASMNAMGEKKGGGAWTWEDFFGEVREQSPEVLRAKMRAVAAAINGRSKKTG